MDDSALARVERQRAELEINVAKLRKALRHWQTLEVDYEGLREGFFGIPDNSSAEDCLQAGNDSKPEIVNEKELQELLLDNNSRPRRPTQLVELLSKRIDYVVRNVETIRKQLSDAEKKRNALLLAEQPDHRDEAGLPLAEIVEELDESGRVISSKVQSPGSDAPQLLDVLKKAGVEDLAQTNGTITAAPPTSKDVDDTILETGVRQDRLRAPVASVEVPETALGQEQLPSNPADTPEEAELRREMLEYSRGLDEVGAIVAELELEEDASDVSFDEDDLDLDLEPELADDQEFGEDSEDDTGKSKHSLSLSPGYKKRMEELQQQLGLKNVGPQPQEGRAIKELELDQRPTAAEAARQAAIARDEGTKSALKSARKQASEDDASVREKARKKKVNFSSELDVAPETTAAITSGSVRPSTKEKEKPRLRPINDSIIERTADQDDVDPSSPASSTPQSVKQSRFKTTRQAQPQTPMFAPPMKFPRDSQKDAPTPQPPSKAITANVIERPSPKVAKAPDSDDFSDEAHHREIAAEYQQNRIKRIHAQDGRFLGNSEEGEMTPLEDEETGRRVSRFKAARVKR